MLQVLWEMLTREVPFKGMEGVQVAWFVVTKEEVCVENVPLLTVADTGVGSTTPSCNNIHIPKYFELYPPLPPT